MAVKPRASLSSRSHFAAGGAGLRPAGSVRMSEFTAISSPHPIVRFRLALKLLLVIHRERERVIEMSMRTWYRSLFGRVAVVPPVANTRDLAEGGDAEAQFALGLQCTEVGVASADSAQAVRWFRRAAEQDHPSAQLKLGLMLAVGDGVARDDEQALGWIRKAAEGGDAGAQFNLGSRCHRRSVDPLDGDRPFARRDAYKWFRIAAGQGYTGAEAACERVALDMSLEEVSEVGHQVARFVPRGMVVPSTSVKTV